jgi:DNA-binding response OmpR family regulator
MDTYGQQADPQRKDILIVDDDPDTCQLLAALFDIRGYSTEIAHGGQQAIECVAIHEPDAIILDVMMPDMDGWETFRRIRRISQAPVLFLSAMNSRENATLALDIGGKDYVQKPFHLDDLFVRTQAILDEGEIGELKKISTPSRQEISIPPAISVVIPAYNEERFIGSMVLKAREFADCVIVVDDGSIDDTAQIARTAGAVVLQHETNKGKGAALNTGFAKARELFPQVVVTLDADGQHSPEEMTTVVEPVLAGKADIVVGSRYLNHTPQVPRHRRWGHWFFNYFTYSISGISSSDSQSGYRAFSPKAIEAISFHSNGFSVESEMQFIANQKNLKLVEVPITVKYLDKPKRFVLKHGFLVLNGIFRLTGQYRPLYYFGLSGLLLMLFGIGSGAWVAQRYIQVHQFAIGTAMGSLLFILIGLMLLSTGFTLHSIRGLLTDILQKKGNYN